MRFFSPKGIHIPSQALQVTALGKWQYKEPEILKAEHSASDFKTAWLVVRTVS